MATEALKAELTAIEARVNAAKGSAKESLERQFAERLAHLKTRLGEKPAG